MTGVLQTVLSILNPEVGADGENAHTDTARVQRGKRTRDDEEERRQTREFRQAIGDSLGSLARANEDMALTQAIGQKEEVLNREEDKMVRFQMLRFETDDADTRRCNYFDGLVDHHSAKVLGHLDELKGLKRRLRRHRRARMSATGAAGSDSDDASVNVRND